MDSTDLLAREEEFKKLNKQLEKKTISLMKEIESVMNEDSITNYQPRYLSSTFTSSKKSPKETKEDQPVHTPSSALCQGAEDTKNITPPQSSHARQKAKSNAIIKTVQQSNDTSFVQAFIQVNIKSGVLPEVFSKETSVEKICKFLASKVSILDEQVTKIQSNLDRKLKQCDIHMNKLADHETEKLKLLNNLNNLRCSSADAKSKSAVIQSRLEEKDKLYKQQRSEADKLSAELKTVRVESASLEAKCANQAQEIERLKQHIDYMKSVEKETKTTQRETITSLTSAISNLQSKVKCLEKVISKQKSLIANLREQKRILSTDICTRNLEKDYVEFLDLK